jgi:outer membrane protein assembly factor BamB
VAGSRLYVPSHDGNLYVLRTTDLSTIWSIPIAGPGDVESPVVANGVLYLGGMTNGRLDAVSLTGRSLLWSSSLVDDFNTAPAVANGVVYAIASDVGSVSAFPAACSNPRTPIWSASVPETDAYSSVAVADGVLYVGTKTGFSAFDLPSAKQAPPRPSFVDLVPDASLKAQVTG